MKSKTLFFLLKFLGFLFVGFMWFRFAFPFMLSYADTFVVIFGMVSTAIFSLTWIFLISKFITKFIKQNENN